MSKDPRQSLQLSSTALVVSISSYHNHYTLIILSNPDKSTMPTLAEFRRMQQRNVLSEEDLGALNRKEVPDEYRKLAKHFALRYIDQKRATENALDQREEMCAMVRELRHAGIRLFDATRMAMWQVADRRWNELLADERAFGEDNETKAYREERHQVYTMIHREVQEFDNKLRADGLVPGSERREELEEQRMAERMRLMAEASRSDGSSKSDSVVPYQQRLTLHSDRSNGHSRQYGKTRHAGESEWQISRTRPRLPTLVEEEEQALSQDRMFSTPCHGDAAIQSERDGSRPSPIGAGLRLCSASENAEASDTEQKASTETSETISEHPASVFPTRGECFVPGEWVD